jgi:hypothetical protein
MTSQFQIKEMISKWNWMMDYCKSNFLHPGNQSAWEEAKKAYDEFIKTKEAQK